MDTAAQVLLNGLLAGSVYGVLAMGFALVFRVHHFFFIAFGALVPVGAYMTFQITGKWGFPIWIGVCGAVIISSVLSGALDVSVHRLLRRRQATGLVKFVGSTALFMLIGDFVVLLYGTGAQRLPIAVEVGVSTFGVTVPFPQLVNLCGAVLLALFVWLTIHHTRFGLKVRAIADDVVKASQAGIRPEFFYLVVTMASGALAAVGGIMMATGGGFRFDMGLYAGTIAIVATLITGAGFVSPFVGGLIIGVIENLGTLLLPSGYEQMIVYGILVGILIVREDRSAVAIGNSN